MIPSRGVTTEKRCSLTTSFIDLNHPTYRVLPAIPSSLFQTFSINSVSGTVPVASYRGESNTCIARIIASSGSRCTNKIGCLLQRTLTLFLKARSQRRLTDPFQMKFHLTPASQVCNEDLYDESYEREFRTIRICPQTSITTMPHITTTESRKIMLSPITQLTPLSASKLNQNPSDEQQCLKTSSDSEDYRKERSLLYDFEGDEIEDSSETDYGISEDCHIHGCINAQEYTNGALEMCVKSYGKRGECDGTVDTASSDDDDSTTFGYEAVDDLIADEPSIFFADDDFDSGRNVDDEVFQGEEEWSDENEDDYIDDEY